MDLQQHGRGGRTESRRSSLRCFDSCCDSCFDHSSAGSPDYLVLSTRGTYSTPVAAAAAAAAAGTATGANVAATALAQQPVAETLAAAHTSAVEESTGTSQASQEDAAGHQPSNPVGMLPHPRNTTLLQSVRQQQFFANKCYHPPLLSPFLITTPSKSVRKCYHTPNFNIPPSWAL